MIQLNKETLGIVLGLLFLIIINSSNSSIINDESISETVQYNNYAQLIMIGLAFYLGEKTDSKIMTLLVVTGILVIISNAHWEEINKAISNMYILKRIENFSE